MARIRGLGLPHKKRRGAPHDGAAQQVADAAVPAGPLPREEELARTLEAHLTERLTRIRRQIHGAAE